MKSNGLWQKGPLPITVVMITLNEAHNMPDILKNISNWASNVFVIDSYSSDETVDICLQAGVNVVQRNFSNFGDQWNFAISLAESSNPWLIKLDPDERLTQSLKDEIELAINEDSYFGFFIDIQLFFLKKPIPVKLNMMRLFKSKYGRFSDSLANEHLIIQGNTGHLSGMIEHHDSPNLHHWFNKQNQYTTLEALNQLLGFKLAFKPKLFGSPLERRLWIKKFFWILPFRYFFLFLYHYIYLGTFKIGHVGYIWAKLRTFVYWQWEIKYFEFLNTNAPREILAQSKGLPDLRVKQF